MTSIRCLSSSRLRSCGWLFFILFFAGTATILTSCQLPADDFVWVGLGSEGDWSDADNWKNVTVGGMDVDGIPDADDVVNFPIDAATTNGQIHELQVEQGVTLTLQIGQVEIDASTKQSFIDNQGVITFQADPDNELERLRIVGDVEIIGAGEIILTESDSFITSSADNATLTNVDNLIRGTGTIGVPLFNQATVRAESGLLFVNTLDNSLGSMEVAHDGLLYALDDVVGGVISGESGATLTGNQVPDGNYRDLTLEGHFTIGSPISNETLLGGTITNNAVLQFLGDPNSSSQERLRIAGEVTLNGTGQIVLVEADDSEIDGYLEDAVLTNVSNTIRGIGQINVEMVNQGVIRAEGGLLETNEPINNDTGRLEIASDGGLQLRELVTGGTIFGDKGGRLGSTSELHDVTFDGVTEVVGAAIRGNLTNLGLINLTRETGSATFNVPLGETVDLIGEGEIIMKYHGQGGLNGFRGSGSLTNVDNFIHGSGGLTTSLLTNQSFIKAEGGMLVIGHCDNQDGVIEICGDAILVADVFGGTIIGEPDAILSGGNYRNLTLQGVHTIDESGAVFMDCIDNRGVITFAGDSSSSDEVLEIDQISVSDEMVLLGGGEVVLVEEDDSRICAAPFSSVEFVNMDNTIRGTGRIDVNVINHGTVYADSASGSLCFQETLQMEKSGTLAVKLDGDGFAESGHLDIFNLFADGVLKLVVGEQLEAEVGDFYEIISSFPSDGLLEFDLIDQSNNRSATHGYEFALFKDPLGLIVEVSDKYLLGDVNMDGIVSLLDVTPFVELVSNQEFAREADLNGDGIVSLLDVAPFVALLAG